MSGQLELASGGGVLVLEIGLPKALRNDCPWYHCPILPSAKAAAGSLKDQKRKTLKSHASSRKAPCSKSGDQSPRDDLSCSKVSKQQQVMYSLVVLWESSLPLNP